MVEEFLFLFSDIRQCRRHIIRRMSLHGFHVISFLSRENIVFVSYPAMENTV